MYYVNIYLIGIKIYKKLIKKTDVFDLTFKPNTSTIFELFLFIF